MPKQYEAIRDKFVSKGMDLKSAKTSAAKIYNSKHPSNPVTGKSDDQKFVDHTKAKMGKNYMKLGGKK